MSVNRREVLTSMAAALPTAGVSWQPRRREWVPAPDARPEAGRERTDDGNGSPRGATPPPADDVDRTTPPAIDELRVGIWRDRSAPYLDAWAEAIANLRALEAYVTSIAGWSTVTWDTHYTPDESVAVDTLSGDGLAAALPDGAVGARRVNVVITDRAGWRNLGACHYTDFYGRRSGHGVLAHQNVSLPQTDGLVAIPLRYVEPNIVHEMLHGLTPHPARTEHQLGRQVVERVTESSPWPWEDERTRTIVKPSCLATGYTNRWQSGETDDWTDCAGDPWRRAALWNTRPRTAISPCADAAVRRYLGGHVIEATGFSWDRPYL